MTEKTYDITFDSDGWSCRSQGKLLGSFPSWLLAVGALRAMADKDRNSGIAPVIRYQDLKGDMQTLDLNAGNTDQPPRHHDPKILKNIDRIAGAQRVH